MTEREQKRRSGGFEVEARVNKLLMLKDGGIS